MALGIFGISVSGLMAAQAGIRTTQNNISNANTAGYHRQDTLFSAQAPTFAGAAWFGSGTAIDTVQRNYNQFLDNEVLRDQTQLSGQTVYSSQASQVDSLLGGANSGLTDALNSFFNAANDVANDPTASTPRQVLLANGNNLTGRVNNLYSTLQQHVDDSNKAIASLSTQINTYSKQIATLNQSISRLEAQNGQPANDLRDQRDQAIADLNKLASVTTMQQSDGQVNVFIGNGQALVSGSQANLLNAPVADPNDTSNLSPAPLLPQLNVSGANITLDSGQISGGQLGGWLAERNDVLKPALAALNRIAVAIGATVNQVNNGGAYYDTTTSSMVQGGDFFSGVVTQTGGTTDWVGVNLTSNRLANDNFTVAYNAGNYTVTRASDGASASFAAGAEVTFGGVPQGFSVAVGTPAPGAGDTWSLNFQNYAHSMSVQITNPDHIAAAAATTSGAGDNTNMLAMAALQTTSVLDNGTTTISGAYTQLMSNTASLASQADLNTQTFTSLVSQATSAQQSVSGVNLDEEAANLIRFQQAYQASAKALSVANTLFDAILAIQP
jgi:flagellar hook-associated protein 1 FlgK